MDGAETSTRVAWWKNTQKKHKSYNKDRADHCQPNQEAINRLRNYVPPPTAYEHVPLTRRAAVLLLLYADPNGDLKIVITIRAKTLSSCTYTPFLARALRPALFSGPRS